MPDYTKHWSRFPEPWELLVIGSLLGALVWAVSHA